MECTNALCVLATQVGIGDTTPNTGLKLDVEGKIGATEYCNQVGKCLSIDEMGGSKGPTFGGMYRYWNCIGNGCSYSYECKNTNPYTNGCSCPTGFISYPLLVDSSSGTLFDEPVSYNVYIAYCTNKEVDCTPDTCSSLGYNCGTWSDGCAGTLNCGACSSGYYCNSGVCTTIPCSSSCSPECGGYNGCGELCDCGNGESCVSGTCLCDDPEPGACN